MADENAGAAGPAQGGQNNQGGAASQQGTGSGAAGGNAGANGAPWHAAVDQGIREFWAAKKYDQRPDLMSDPVKMLDAVSRSYQATEKFVGVPAEELLRMPKPNADSTEVNNFYNRLGVPKEAKDYDFSAVKMADGSEVDPALADTLRASLHANRVAKDSAPAVLRDVVKYLDGVKTGIEANKTAYVQSQEQELDRNWGNRKAYNMTVAMDALDRIGAAAGLSQQQIKEGWDALTTVGGIGASYAIEMLRTIGSRMGEHDFVGPGQARTGDTGAMSQEQARAEIAALNNDQDFVRRYLAGNVEAWRKMKNLHQIVAGSQTVAP